MSDRQHRIEQALSILQPATLKVINDSARHYGHAGDDGSGETHFIIEIEAPLLDGLSRVDRQRRIMDLLAGEFETGLHALTIHGARLTKQ